MTVGFPIIVNSMDTSAYDNLPSSTGTRSPARASSNKLVQTSGNVINGTDRAGSLPIDPNALSKALKDFEDARRTRDRTPGASPSRKRQRIYGDRSVDINEAVGMVVHTRSRRGPLRPPPLRQENFMRSGIPQLIRFIGVRS